MQYEQTSSQPVCTRSMNAARPMLCGVIRAPHGPGPSPKRSAVVPSPGRSRSTRASLSSLGTTSGAPGRAAISWPARVA